MNGNPAVNSVNYVLCCDWGTTNLRLSLVKVPTQNVRFQISEALGVKTVFEDWQASDRINRTHFYQSVLKQLIDRMASQIGIDLSGVTIAIAGMASSSLGIEELPYASLPIVLASPNLVLKKIEATPNFPHPLLLISGVKKWGDVMRGEEIQAIGWFSQNPSISKGTLIMPGTHSKHMIIEDGQVIDFKTFMTGELYQLLSQQSILQNSVTGTTNDWNQENQTTFRMGVEASQSEPISHALFSIRAKQLNHQFSKTHGVYFLSGLLIGNELSTLREDNPIICGDQKFQLPYSIALRTLYPGIQVKGINPSQVNDFATFGMLKVLNDQLK